MAASALAEIAAKWRNGARHFTQPSNDDKSYANIKVGEPEKDADDFGLPAIDDIMFYLNQSSDKLDTTRFQDLTLPPRRVSDIVLIVVAYSLIVTVSLFGNVLVCRVVWMNRRFHNVTYLFLANLAASDLLITVTNIPINIARNVLEEWPFGAFTCHMVNFSLVASVYVSTLTMTTICFDRYQVIMHPMKQRITKRHTAALLVLLWLVAALLSSPYAIYNREIQVFIYRPITRCQMLLPQQHYRKYLTAATCVTQFFVPVLITGAAYARIAHHLWRHVAPGHATDEQQDNQNKVRRKTIQMLILVVVVFSLCWLPLNTYHLVANFHPDRSSTFSYNGTVYFVLHWFAMSSVCYNPFIYCWLNKVFRDEVKNIFHRCYRMSGKVHPGVDHDGILVRADSKYRYHSQQTHTRVQHTSLTTTARGRGSLEEGATTESPPTQPVRRGVCVTSSVNSVEATYSADTNSVVLKVHLPKRGSRSLQQQQQACSDSSDGEMSNTAAPLVASSSSASLPDVIKQMVVSDGADANTEMPARAGDHI